MEPVVDSNRTILELKLFLLRHLSLLPYDSNRTILELKRKSCYFFIGGFCEILIGLY